MGGTGQEEPNALPAPVLPTGDGDWAWHGSGSKTVVKPAKYDGSTDLYVVNGWDA